MNRDEGMKGRRSGPVVLLACILFSCSSSLCDPQTALEMGAACKLKVQTECVDMNVPQDECEPLKDCRAQAKARQDKCLP